MSGHILPAFGLPFAPAGVDDDGYYVKCPVDGQKFYGPAGDEDTTTKGAVRAYGEHFETAAKAESGG